MDAAAPSPLARLVVMLTACAMACAAFAALGAWQVERLVWKRALIARVERNAQAVPVAAPGPAQWGQLTREDEYRRVQASGRFDAGREVLVAATTALGGGYWVLTPLQTEQGAWLLVNRGFVPPDLRGKVPAPATQGEVVGLLRSSETGGRPLQQNDPAAGRWYSRDVAAIAAAQGLTGLVAPYFVDQVAAPGAAPQWPRPGLTVLSFRNNHLAHALTWFALAAIMAAALVFVVLDARRQRRGAPDAPPC